MDSNGISSLSYGASCQAGGLAPPLPVAFYFRLLAPWEVFTVLLQVAVGQEGEVTDTIILTGTKRVVDK